MAPDSFFKPPARPPMLIVVFIAAWRHAQHRCLARETTLHVNWTFHGRARA